MTIVVIADTPVITVDENTNTVYTLQESNVISTVNSINSIVPSLSSNLVVTEEIYTINASSPNSVLISAGIQGPIGISGTEGSSSVSLISPNTLGSNRAVTASIDYASSSDLTTVSKTIGFTQGSVVSGNLVTIVLSGPLDGFSGFTINLPVYLSTLGTVTQTVPTSGYIQKVGVALTTTKLLINLDPPILL